MPTITTNASTNIVRVTALSGQVPANATIKTGGQAGQVYGKNSAADYDVDWITPAGSGDMLVAVYDPTSVAGDAFDMDSMVEGTTTKILTDTERSAIAANTAKETNATHTGDVTGSTTLTIADGAVTQAKTDSGVQASLGLADSATQPGDLATVATSGSYADLTSKPTIPTVDDTAYASSWSGNTDAPTKNAVYDKIETIGGGGSSIEVEDEGVSLTTAVTKFNFVGSGVTVTEPVADEVQVTIAGGAAPVDSVNTQTGAVVLDADDISDASTTNKFITAAEITKLSGIETSATADQTGAEIKAAYESEANAFTDAQFTKLSGIATSADVTNAVNVASSIAGTAGKTTPVDADTVGLIDSAASSVLKNLTWANIKATLKAYFDTLYPGKDTAQVFTKSQGVTPVTLTDGASIATDASLSNIFTVTLAGNRTLANPTNLIAGKTYIWIVTQDGTGARTLAYGSYFKFPGGSAPTLTTAADSIDMVVGIATSTTALICNSVLDFQ